jgi:hypothetical protein
MYFVPFHIRKWIFVPYLIEKCKFVPCEIHFGFCSYQNSISEIDDEQNILIDIETLKNLCPVPPQDCILRMSLTI